MEEKNEILLILTDEWCDWEASYAIAVANSFSDYVVKTASVDGEAKTSMGNLRAMADYRLGDYAELSRLALVLLPGGLSWEENDYGEIADFLRRAQAALVPIAAICGATTFLCRNGFLDDIRHTGDSRELFAGQSGYRGHAHYVEAQLVSDGGIITANETAAVQFAYEIFKLLKLDSEEELAAWYENFRRGAVRE